MPAFDIQLEVSHGDTVSPERINKAMLSVIDAMYNVVEPFNVARNEEHPEHSAIVWIFRVEADQRFEVQYMEKALENLVRVALKGAIVRVTTSSQPATVTA